MNVWLKFQTLITEIRQYFLWKKFEKLDGPEAAHIVYKMSKTNRKLKNDDNNSNPLQMHCLGTRAREIVGFVGSGPIFES